MLGRYRAGGLLSHWTTCSVVGFDEVEAYFKSVLFGRRCLGRIGYRVFGDHPWGLKMLCAGLLFGVSRLCSGTRGTCEECCNDPMSRRVHPEKKGKTWTAPVIAVARYAAIRGVSRSAFRPRHECDGPRCRVLKPEPGQAGRFACRTRPHHRGQNRDGIPRKSSDDLTPNNGIGLE
ncbi:hypothetical protein Taro_027972 [Colocasia esculenta]|uniref:Uncharacterized protein n=1 Tax=Colocasia esculenta TaxID=4460 RepID=A0A843VF90_COLES|nr:hypothetical protein [Colocasia esculenta]